MAEHQETLKRIGSDQDVCDGYRIFATRYADSHGTAVWTVRAHSSSNGLQTGRYWISEGVFRELFGPFQDENAVNLKLVYGSILLAVPPEEKAAILKQLEVWEGRHLDVG